jgi:hypothetical protein
MIGASLNKLAHPPGSTSTNLDQLGGIGGERHRTGPGRRGLGQQRLARSEARKQMFDVTVLRIW